MPLLDAIATYVRAPSGRSTDEIKAEIRDELEFHLAMSAQENERSGMSPADALVTASSQFGDLSAIERSCRQIQLGERSILQRTQVSVMLATLLIVVLFAITSYRSQARQSAALDGLSESLQQLQQNVTIIADRAAPVVVETFPATGATQVDPSAKEIRVTFSKAMMDKSWSWCQTEQPFPNSTGPIHYADDKTCVMPVQLEPNTEYVVQINSRKFGNFKDETGRSAVPYLLCFSTAGSK